MKKNIELIFFRGMRKILHKLKKEKLIFSFSREEKNFLVKWQETSPQTRIHISFLNGEVDILPSNILRGYYNFDTLNFYLVYGKNFQIKHIKDLEKNLKKEALSRKKGFILENNFFIQTEGIIKEKTSPVIGIKKTNNFEELNGEGDFILTMKHDIKINVDIKSSDFGVHQFKNKNKKRKKKVIAFNSNGLGKKEIIHFFWKIYNLYKPKTVTVGF